MNYIYDVVTNFSSVPYDFFEWNKGDNVNHLKKVLVTKINTKTLYDFLYNKVKISNEFLETIKNKTEFFNKEEYPNYISIFTDGKVAVCIKFNQSGININRSYLPGDEDEEALDLSDNLIETQIRYKCIEKNYKNTFKTRRETHLYNYVLKSIKNLDENSDFQKLKYIYYDCFNEQEDDKIKIMNTIYNNLENNEILEKIYDFLKLLSTKTH